MTDDKTIAALRAELDEARSREVEYQRQTVEFVEAERETIRQLRAELATVRAAERERIAVALEARADHLHRVALGAPIFASTLIDDEAGICGVIAADIRSGALAGEADVAPATEPAK